MKALVIQNAANTPLGLVGDHLKERHGFEIETLDAAQADFSGMDPYRADLFVILGSPRGVYEQDVSWIAGELDFTKRLLAERRPVFGICFGGQMIAAALGAVVKPMGERHRGWLTNDMAVDEVWSGPWFRWHGDSFELPQGARTLAMAGPVPQAFQHGKAVAVQFHPEIDLAIVEAWVEEGLHDLIRDGVDLEQFLSETKSSADRVHERLAELMDDVVRRCMS